MPDANIRHDIEPALVAAQVEARLAEIERLRANAKTNAVKTREAYARSTVWSGRPPSTDEEIDAIFDGWIERENTHYALVRVIRLANREGKSYILVYGDEDDDTVGSGTGPFETLDKAKAWFLGGGR